MSTHEQATATLPDAPLYLECPMCRATIDAESIAGVCASCPLYHMTSGCRIDLIACPDCGYHSLPQEHPGAAPVTARVDGPRSAVGTADGPAPPPAAAACSGAMRLSDVPAGTKARLLGFSGIGDNHLGRLTRSDGVRISTRSPTLRARRAPGGWPQRHPASPRRWRFAARPPEAGGTRPPKGRPRRSYAANRPSSPGACPIESTCESFPDAGRLASLPRAR